MFVVLQIWSFKMKAPCCGQEIVIQTDPKNTLYVIMSGAKEKTVTYDEVDAETTLLPEKEDRGKLADPFYKLEHEGEDTAKAKKQAPLLVRLQEAADMKHYDSYARNKALRAQLRVCFLFFLPTIAVIYI
jgi:coiled-coil domain-containing protein 130